MRPNGPRYQRYILALACAGMFMVVLDATIVSVALPAMSAELGFSHTTLPWVVNAFTLPFAGFLLLGGRCSDVYGRRVVLLIGMGLFTGAGVAGGLAGSPGLLLAARALQGFGGAFLMPATLALVTATFPAGSARTRALSTWSAVGAIGAACGPILGGLLTQIIGWRAIFFVNVPFGILVLAGCALVVRDAHPGGARLRLDIAGAILGTAGLVGIVYAVMASGTVGWATPEVLGSCIAGVVVLLVFAVHQLRWADDPLIPSRLFTASPVRSANSVMFLVSLGFFASPVLISLTLHDVYGRGPLESGLLYLPCGIAMFLGARAAGPLTIRIGARRTTVVGCAVGATGFTCAAATTASPHSGLISVIASTVLFGLGTASAFTPLTVTATHVDDPGLAGIAAAVFNTVRQTSSALGLAILTTVADATAARHPADPTAPAHGYAAAYAVSAICVLAAAVVAAITMRRNHPSEENGPGRSRAHTR